MIGHLSACGVIAWVADFTSWSSKALRLVVGLACVPVPALSAELQPTLTCGPLDVFEGYRPWRVYPPIAITHLGLIDHVYVGISDMNDAAGVQAFESSHCRLICM